MAAQASATIKQDQSQAAAGFVRWGGVLNLVQLLTLQALA